MTIPVRKMLVQSKNHKIKCPNIMAAEYITVHNTYNDGPGTRTHPVTGQKNSNHRGMDIAVPKGTLII